jgi:hypothetical protein
MYNVIAEVSYKLRSLRLGSTVIIAKLNKMKYVVPKTAKDYVSLFKSAGI